LNAGNTHARLWCVR